MKLPCPKKFDTMVEMLILISQILHDFCAPIKFSRKSISPSSSFLIGENPFFFPHSWLLMQINLRLIKTKLIIIHIYVCMYVYMCLRILWYSTPQTDLTNLLSQPMRWESHTTILHLDYMQAN